MVGRLKYLPVFYLKRPIFHNHVLVTLELSEWLIPLKKNKQKWGRVG